MLRSELWRSTFRTFSMLPKRGTAIVTTAGDLAARRSMFGPIAAHFVCIPTTALLPLTGRAYLYRGLLSLLLVAAIGSLGMRASHSTLEPRPPEEPPPVAWQTAQSGRVRTRGGRRG
jgi:hypothetical protein